MHDVTLFQVIDQIMDDPKRRERIEYLMAAIEADLKDVSTSSPASMSLGARIRSTLNAGRERLVLLSETINFDGPEMSLTTGIRGSEDTLLRIGIDDPSGDWSLLVTGFPQGSRFRVELELCEFGLGEVVPEDCWVPRALLGEEELTVSRDTLGDLEGAWKIDRTLTEDEIEQLIIGVTLLDEEA